jgi:pimeloyl-ACP methyl ester carboxylesterase
MIDPEDLPLHRSLRPPAKRLLILEQRAAFELGALVAGAPLLRKMGRGDRHPVLVMPGFTASDQSTAGLRYLIRSWGYWAHGWGLGANVGPTMEKLAGIRDRLEALHSRHGARVSLVGWSLGGLYARYLARQMPEMVRNVITLGSPLQMTQGDRSSASGVADRLQHLFDPAFIEMADYERGPLPVPSTAVYTRTDGIVRWQVCLDIADDSHENVEVRGSHSGLGFNPSVLYVIADRLGQAEDSWRPFRPPLALRPLYPKPASWDPVRKVST